MNKILEQLVWIGTKPGLFTLTAIYLTEGLTRLVLVYRPTGEQLEFSVNSVSSDENFVSTFVGRPVDSVTLRLSNEYNTTVDIVFKLGYNHYHRLNFIISLQNTNS